MTNIKLIASSLQSIYDYLRELILAGIKFSNFRSISQKIVPAKIIVKLSIRKVREI